MKDIVFLSPDKIDSKPFTTSKVIAEMTGIEHRKIKVTIRKYQGDINSFGLSASYQAESTGGRPEEIIKLNEAQATFLMTLLKNTPIVVEFKKELVRQFYAMRQELLKRQTGRAELKPIRRELTDVIKEREPGDKWAYKKYTDLAYKSVVGKNSAQIRKERKAPKKAAAIDYMKSDEIEAITKRQNQIAVLLEMGMDYTQVKSIVTGSAIQAKAS